MPDLNNNEKYLRMSIVIASILVILIFCASTVYTILDIKKQAEYEAARSKLRDYSLNPFRMTDAIDICQDEAKLKLGRRLLDTSVNNHSTRYDTRRKFFLIVLDARIGSTSQYDPGQVLCHVDPKQYVVYYFKASNQRYKEFSLNFFKH